MKKYIFLSIALYTAMALLTGCADQTTDKDKGKTKKVTFDAKVIYGDDDRFDLYEVTDSVLLKLARSTVALMSNRDLSQVTGGDYQVDQTTFGQAYGLCSSEPYRDQNNAAFCSGFLVGPRLIATAGHCIRSAGDCSGTKFVFDYALKAKGVNPKIISKNNVYSCAKIVHTVVQNGGKDFAVVEVDRDVTGYQPLTLRRTGSVAKGDELVVIGHPAGLPTKVAGGASVRKIESSYFVANLDTYGGNSGSAVFNKITGEVEGILVRGENDFITKNGCKVSNRCLDDGCRGEDVTKISEALTYIPAVNNSSTTTNTRKAYISTVKLAIPDNNVTGINSSLLTDESPRGRKVYVEVNITHSWRGDLYISLISPDGVEYILTNREGRSEKNVIGTFGKDLTADLSAAAQVNRAGIWSLRVSDRALRDIGQINSWSLIFE